MKKLLILIIAFLFFSPTAEAFLVDNLDGTITQIRSDGSQLMWMQDANYAMSSGFDPDGQITQFDAITWASNLTFAGYTGWRLPVTYQNAAGSGGYNSDSEMGDLYYNELGNTAGSFTNAGPFFNIMDYWYWTSVDFVDPDFVMVFSFLDIPSSPSNEAGWEAAGGKYGVTYAWLVRDILLSTISGFVTDSSHVPIHEAGVKLKQSGSFTDETTTDMNGYYEFNDLPDGRYVIVANKNGYSKDKKIGKLNQSRPWSEEEFINLILE